jgi:hypothetical protein
MVQWLIFFMSLCVITPKQARRSLDHYISLIDSPTCTCTAAADDSRTWASNMIGEPLTRPVPLDQLRAFLESPLGGPLPVLPMRMLSLQADASCAHVVQSLVVAQSAEELASYVSSTIGTRSSGMTENSLLGTTQLFVDRWLTLLYKLTGVRSCRVGLYKLPFE